MPTSPPRACVRCGTLVPKGKPCPVCEAKRGTARQRGYTARWERERLLFLRDHPLCVDCLAGVPLGPNDKGTKHVAPATVVDHIKPHKGDVMLFFDKANLQGLCETHHNRKTAMRDRGEWSPT